MTDWITWNGGDCPIKSDKTIVEYKSFNRLTGVNLGMNLCWNHMVPLLSSDIIAYRIIEDHEPMTKTREQITAQIEVLQKQLDAMTVVRRWWCSDGDFVLNRDPMPNPFVTHYFDIETINGVPHIHGIAMKECGK
jgi:hypothetical protein